MAYQLLIPPWTWIGDTQMLSFPQNIPVIVEWVVDQMFDGGINSVCDIGCGMGKYGLLIKERYLSRRAEQNFYPKWDKTLIGIEDNSFFFENSPLEKIYDRAYFRNAIGNGVPEADLYLIIDVCEHYMRDNFEAFVDTLIGKTVLVSTPKRTVMYTEPYYGDPRHHITQFTAEDFDGWNVNLSTEQSWIFAMTAR